MLYDAPTKGAARAPPQATNQGQGVVEVDIHLTWATACQQDHQERPFLYFLVPPRPVQQTPLNPPPPYPPTQPLTPLLPISTPKLASFKHIFARFDQDWQHWVHTPLHVVLLMAP